MKVAIADLSIVEDEEGQFNPESRTRDTTDLQQSMQARIGRGQAPLIEPIVISPTNGNGKHKLISGHRRVTAARALGLKTVSAVVDADEEILLVMVAANNHMDFFPMEEATLVQRLAKHGHTNAQIRAAFGWTENDLQLRVDLHAADPKVQDLVDSGKMSWSAFRTICKESKERQEIIAEKAEGKSRSERVTITSVRSAKKEVQDEENGERIAGDEVTLNERLNEIRAQIQAVFALAPFSDAEKVSGAWLVDKLREDLEELGPKFRV